MSQENLSNKEAIEKIKDIVNEIDFAMMVTNLGNAPLSAIPMSTKKVDDNGDIWFLSNKNSDHNKDITNDSRCQLLYSSGSDMKFLSLYGTATIVTNRTIIEELYSKADDIWFDGVNDPNITAIKVDPNNSVYWDSGSSKLVSLFKMAKGAITGEKQDIGRTGTLNT
ncbi:pyridoxamine 5'-phosphate oxidase family protein [Patiriisocius marinus]|uniref:General stress protein n=1 Tax=Patiriisocius marinus TaxID=1397112 RepID=A0A5J4IRR0_9FLAO|nr:pyridoxamine 5'-phosphate oxidase family protein [Patiriisocius marinus]GER60609.1 general stress protein [Patiriisocius marinus]